MNESQDIALMGEAIVEWESVMCEEELMYLGWILYKNVWFPFFSSWKVGSGIPES
jgi:hypothetical protein